MQEIENTIILNKRSISNAGKHYIYVNTFADSLDIEISMQEVVEL